MQDDKKPSGMGGKKKSVKILDGKENSALTGNEGGVRQSVGKPILKQSRSPTGGRGRSGSRKREESPVTYNSPRQKLYEAKFEKYLANKEQKLK